MTSAVTTPFPTPATPTTGSTAMEPDVQVNAGPGFDSLPATEMTGSAVFYQRAMQGSGFDSWQIDSVAFVHG